METTAKKLNSREYLQLTTGEEFLLQCPTEDIKVVVSDSKPLLNAAYIMLPPAEVLTHNQVTGTVWALAAGGGADTAKVTVIE